MRTQRQLHALFVTTVHVEGVLHGTGGMVGRVVERGKTVPIAFDFRTVGNIKADGSKNLFNAHPGADHGMDAAACNATARKRDVNRFGSELGLHGNVGEFFATGVQKRLDLSLCLIDSRTAFSLLFRREAGQTTHQRSDGSVLADVLCFGVFERGILLSGRKIGACRFHDLH